MAQIKCRWSIPYCGASLRGANCEFDSPCLNVLGFGNDGCENFVSENDGSCDHIQYRTYQIDKEVKSYELSDEELRIGRKVIQVDDMEELVIDGTEYAFRFAPEIDQYLLPQVIDWNKTESEEEK